MKIALSLLLAIVVHLTVGGQTWINAADAREHKGQLVNIVGYVTDINLASRGKYKGPLLTIAGTEPNVPLTLLIMSRENARREDLEVAYLNNYVHVKGRVIIRKGKPCIIVSHANQIAVVHESPEWNRYEPL